MRQRLFNVFALACTVVLFVLLCGYFGRFGPIFVKGSPPSSPPALRLISVSADRGRCVLWIQRWNGTLVPSSRARGTHVDWDTEFRPFRPSSLSRSLWDFDGHRITIPNPAATAFIVAFPIWCLAVPCAIPPFMWLRRRRRLARRGVQGFEVAAPATPIT